jgi:hypothetical protein
MGKDKRQGKPKKPRSLEEHTFVHGGQTAEELVEYAQNRDADARRAILWIVKRELQPGRPLGEALSKQLEPIRAHLVDAFSKAFKDGDLNATLGFEKRPPGRPPYPENHRLRDQVIVKEFYWNWLSGLSKTKAVDAVAQSRGGGGGGDVREIWRTLKRGERYLQTLKWITAVNVRLLMDNEGLNKEEAIALEAKRLEALPDRVREVFEANNR